MWLLSPVFLTMERLMRSSKLVKIARRRKNAELSAKGRTKAQIKRNKAKKARKSQVRHEI